MNEIQHRSAIQVIDATPPMANHDRSRMEPCRVDDARELQWLRRTYAYERLVDTLGLVADETDYLISARPASSVVSPHPQLDVDDDFATMGMVRQFETSVLDGRILHIACNEDGTRVAYRYGEAAW